MGVERPNGILAGPQQRPALLATAKHSSMVLLPAPSLLGMQLHTEKGFGALGLKFPTPKPTGVVRVLDSDVVGARP